MATKATRMLMYGRQYQTGVNWITAIAMIGFHIGAVAALFYIDLGAMLTAVVLWIMAGSFGIGMGYHRLLTHRGYKTPRWVEYFLTLCGTLALEGGPIFWVATHRIHHQKSDKEGDPHTPREGGWWAHMGWILFGEGHHNKTDVLAKYAPDLAADRFYRVLNTYHWVPLTVLGLIAAAIGGWPAVYWVVFLRVVVGLHATWLVNSATHMWGSRRFDIKDDSKNSWWVALITFGEGWHNNHHAHPTSARHGLAWYELDVSWITIRMMRAVGLAKRVRIATAEGYVRKEAA
jgi:stearoyl-CoA desaturase (delta-9 desaturase)